MPWNKAHWWLVQGVGFWICCCHSKLGVSFGGCEAFVVVRRQQSPPRQHFPPHPICFFKRSTFMWFQGVLGGKTQPSSITLVLGAQQFSNIEVPLLDMTTTSLRETNLIQALPSSHLPSELTTLNVYALDLSLPIDKAIMEDALMTRGYNDRQGQLERCFGQVVYKPNRDNWIGAIGCTAKILSAQDLDLIPPNLGELSGTPQRIVCLGMFRFIVRRIVQSVPFVVAVVDELPDNDNISETTTTTRELTGRETSQRSGQEDDYPEEDYSVLTPQVLEQRLMRALREHVQQQLDLASQELSPLELSILQKDQETAELIHSPKEIAQETAAVVEVFAQYIVDESPSLKERYFALALLAAEIFNFPNRLRQYCLRETNGLERLRFVTREAESMVRMTRARNVAKAITDRSDEGQKDLRVGTPALPLWTRQIRKGMRLEYFWNEEYQWVTGQVVQDPIRVSPDEMLITMYFDDDGTTHRLPFSADEKVRWRPAPP